MFDTIHVKFIGIISKNTIKNMEYAGSQGFNNGMNNIQYRYRNFIINVHSSGFSIKGSLAKFLFNGSNFYTLGKVETKVAIEKLSHELEINISKGILTRVDIGTNFVMKESLDNYLCLLGNLKHFMPSFYNKTIYYNNYKKQLIFYNKFLELKKNGIPIPEDFLKYKTRILRYEYRILRRLRGQFNMESVKVKDLFSESFYIRCLDMWKNYYFSISKENKLKLNVSALKNVKSFQTQLMVLGLDKIGFNEAVTMVKHMKDKLTKNQYYRFLYQIKHLSNHAQFTEPHDVILELDNKVKLSVANYR